ncbi:MAG: 5-formyltetrahydrofolate cyclo-ligase [Clostridia bacterium]|nr:5-formyltetrahydrofolate cyclo-ligase [Clostridia bacterium]
MDNQKKALRKELLSLRKSIIPQALSIKMLEKYPEFVTAKTVFCYVSAHGEVDTYGLIQELLKDKKVLAPYCINEDGDMIACPINSLEDLKEGKFKIPEPKSPEEFPKEKIDFVIVPGVAFDKNGYRLGYGKGYYDRFLEGITPFKLGVCQREFFLEELPHGKFDVKMDDVLVI